MSDVLHDGIAAMLRDAAPGDLHWTVILDRALREGLVPPSPDARNQVLHALAEATRAGRIVKTSTGTYRAAGAD